MIDKRFGPAPQRGPLDWPALWAHLRSLDGDAWDVESDRLDDLWQAEYKAAFVACAMGRPGWVREGAEEWAGELAWESLCACRGNDPDPAACAAVDVEEAEMENADAG